MLIDAIVRQTTVLIAQLATAGGERTPLSHTANQVFLDLSRELREQGLGSKVVADMFGMALRTYQTKVQRLSESRTDRGRTLWEAIYEHIRQHASQRSIARAELMQRFRSDDPIAVRSVLRDLVDSGLVLRTGRSDSTRYQFAVQTDDPGAAAPSQRVDQAVLMMVHRLAPVALPQLSETLSLAEEQVGASLVRLQAEGRVRVQPGADGDRYLSDGCILPLGGEQGWEVPVFDHYQALVSSLCSKLRGGTRAQAHDRIGGSTYSYQVWPAHPYFEEATGFLASFRARGSALRKKIAAYNADHPPPESEVVRVVVYGGQNVISAEDEQRESMEESDD
jgi:predicted acetyltransferase